MSQYLGTAEITIDGEVIDTEKGAKFNLGGVERKVREGANSVGFIEERKAAMLDCEIGVTKDTNLEKYRKAVNAVIRFKADTGQVWISRKAFTTNPLEITGGEGGKVPLKMAGEPAETA